MNSRKIESWSARIPNWVIFDLDGTLADLSHRLHMIRDPHSSVIKYDYGQEPFTPDWDSFNMACESDEIITPIKNLLTVMRQANRNIAIFTGRSETAQRKTISWLARHNIEYEVLEMRKSKDHRSDTVVKREMFDKHFTPEDIFFVIEDRDKMVEMWRDLGLTCLQCVKGEY